MLKNVFNKVLGRKKQVVITNQMKVQELSDKANGLFESFRKTHNELEDINNQLQQVIEDETQKIIQIERNRERAIEELQMNKKLQEKLADFIR